MTGAFDLRMRIAVYVGILLASPVWLYQVFAFVAPGLTRRERRYTVGFVGSAVPLFLAGGAAGFAVFPHVVQLLTAFAPTEDTTLLQATYYVDFVLKLVVAVGVAFTIPVFVVLLNLAGVLPARTIRASWRAIVLGVALFAAIATPAADPLSMVLLALPMLGLFALSGAIAECHDRAVRRRATALTPVPPTSERAERELLPQ